MDDFDIEGLFVEPRPDEDGWEAFFNFALERIGGERSDGLTNRQIGELEQVVGVPLPFEVGLLLVMGVPVAHPWHKWDDPAAQFAVWNEQVISGICFDIEHKNFWFGGWGEKPVSVGDQLAVAHEQFESTVSPLFPIYGNRAVPLVPGDAQSSSDGNPVFSVHRSEVVLLGDDLAGWMHKEFEVPLPMWPTEQPKFAFWSELTT